MVFAFKKQYYFDSGSFTPIHPKAAEAMQCVLQVQRRCGLGNPIAVHRPGRTAKEYLDLARTMVAQVYQVKKNNVAFTSGATEANLLALRTAVLHAKRRGLDLADMHILVGHEEHASVYKHVAYFQALGIPYTTATPKDGCRFMPADITKHIHKNTIAISLQLVNSQHGVIQPVADIARASREKHPSVYIHTDAAQATAYYNCSPVSLGVDAVTIDSAKSFGPQGVGALLFQKAHLYTGLQGERSLWDMRPGTPSVALLYGFATALHETCKSRDQLYAKVQRVRNAVVADLQRHFPAMYIHGIEKQAKDIQSSDWKKIAPHLLYLSFADTNHAYLATLLDAKGFAVSTGSACDEVTEGSLRIGVLPTTTRRAIRALARCIQQQLPLARKA
ncbi:MAG: aminotransferase class V-fold PLP-dependent enzyme [Candidatus Kaiserbacteria bacterium]|nr:aminotransferase class V-fold PLP-dependent enzyme [Candidatus Kaiserbacteria bacterium]